MKPSKSIGIFFSAVLLCACGGGDAPDKTGRTDTPSLHGSVSSIAGVGAPGYSDGKISRVSAPTAVAVDRDGNVYVADTANHGIRKLDVVKGTVTTLAGGSVDTENNGQLTGVAGYADGKGAAARFSYPSGIAVDDAGNVYVADSGNNRIRKITPEGDVSTLAGNGVQESIDDGNPLTASFAEPRGIAVDKTGSVVYVADFRGHVVRKITGGGVSTLAGLAGAEGAENGLGAAARFMRPWGLALSSSGVLYVAEAGDWTGSNHLIRKIITSSAAVSTLTGKTGVPGKVDGALADASFSNPSGVAVDSKDNVYVADTGNNTIRKLSVEGQVTVLAGDGSLGAKDDIGTFASFNSPRGIAVDILGDVYVADTDNHLIRKVKK